MLLMASFRSNRSYLRLKRGGFVSPCSPNPLVRREAICQHGNDSKGCSQCKLPALPEANAAA